MTMVVPCAVATGSGECGAECEQSLNLMQLELSPIPPDWVTVPGTMITCNGKDSLVTGGVTAHKTCCSMGFSCKTAGKDYQWCYTGRHARDNSAWDYCQVDDKTSHGWTCRGDCGNHGEDYRWCWTTNGKWDYCVPEVIDAYLKKEESTKPTDVCTKWDTLGWHEGDYLRTLLPGAAPDGKRWMWRQCAARCGEESGCEFWTLQLGAPNACMLMANKGLFHNDNSCEEGPKQDGCKAS